MSRFAILALASAFANAAQSAGNWSFESGRNPDTWENILVLSLESTSEIADEYARNRVRPQLSFYCTPAGDGTLFVRVNWRRFISSFNTEVSFKADERELLLVNWGVDKSNKITMPRSAGDGQELIAYIAGADTLQVEVIPYSDSLVTVRYDISGIDGALQALVDKCT